MTEAARLARGIETELRRRGTPERAAGEKQYLKSDLRFLGATLADIRRVAKEASRDSRLDRAGALGLVGNCGAGRSLNAAWPQRSS